MFADRMSDVTSHPEFPARFYLEKYYSSVGMENAAFMRAAARSVGPVERLGAVVELGGGPSLCALFAMAAATDAGPARVIWADLAPSNLIEVEDWLRGECGAFEYAAVLQWLEEEFDVDRSELAERVRGAEWEFRRLDLRRPLAAGVREVADVVGSHFFAEGATSDEGRFVEMTSRVREAASPGALIALSYIRHSRPYRLDDETLYPSFSLDEDSLPPLLARAGLELAELLVERGPRDDPPARPGYDGMVFATGRLALMGENRITRFR